jgi:hydroxymethylbilane synthase
VNLRIGTRGSDLALWQARHVAAALERAGARTEIAVLQTRGDQIDELPLTAVEGKAFFTAEIERALLERRVDLAVHSHKDLPGEPVPGLEIAAVPPRASPIERLLARPECFAPDAPFLPLADGARVGTSAPRRSEQLLALRPDLAVEPLRGNVPTRVAKLRAGRYDAIVLAAAGLDRLGLDTKGLAAVDLGPELCVPAPAQGALAVQVRAGDAELARLCRSALHDEAAARAVTAERGLLARAGGGCNLPLGACALPFAGGWRAHAFLGAGHPSPAHGAPRWSTGSAPTPEEAVELAWSALADQAPTGCGPLAGLRVALAGSAEAGSRLAARLAALGASVVHEKLIDFAPRDGEELARRVAALRPGDALAVTSRRAARELAGLAPAPGVRVAAVGPATAAVLEQGGLSVHVVGRLGARELARELELAPGARVLFPCGTQARGELAEVLAGRGVEVERLELYDTLTAARPRLEPEVDVRVCMSPSSVAALVEARKAGAPGAAPCLALGPATAAALRAAGVADGGGVPEHAPGQGAAETLVREMARLAARGGRR